MEPFIANTDQRWFDFLSHRAVDGRVDEVNFWSPRAQEPMKAMTPGEPVFFRLKRPERAIAGYGFFAHFSVLELFTAWRLFEWKNGTPYSADFLGRIGAFRRLDLLDPAVVAEPIGCTVLRDARFWPRGRWLPWGASAGWATNIVRGKAERDAARAALLLSTISDDASRRDVSAELAGEFRPLDPGFDERRMRVAESVVREGQGTFRARLLGAYDGRCAITGEHTEPVLDAAHIQPYRGAPSNHLQNGLLLTKEFHALFDLGYVGVTPDYRVRIHPRIKARWNNGKRFYAYEGAPLAAVPRRAAERPSREALAWHMESVFAKA